MRLLSSEKASALEKAIASFEKDGYLTICEPCDCGSHIQHNNGGNYHDIIYLAKDQGRYFAKYDTTSVFEPEAEWEEISKEEASAVIRQHSDWLYSYQCLVNACGP